MPDQPDRTTSTSAAYGVKTEPATWTVSRRGGYVRGGSMGDIRFATIERLDTGFHIIKFHDDRVSSAAMSMGDWDGCGPLGGPVFKTLTEAKDVAERAVRYALDMLWAKDDATESVMRRYKAVAE